MQSLWKFQAARRERAMGSDLFPDMAEARGRPCFLHGMHTEGVAHGPATLLPAHRHAPIRPPVMGSWITYGLGHGEREPARLRHHQSRRSGNGGPRNYGNAFLPAVYQGTRASAARALPAKEAKIQQHQQPRAIARSASSRSSICAALNEEQLRSAPRRHANSRR